MRPGQFRLATRRGKQFNSIIQAERDGLTGACRDHVLISAEDMDSLSLREDQPIRVFSEHGSLQGRALGAPITPGNLQMHWPEANVLIESGPQDPGGRVPDYNAVVTIEKA